MSETFRKRGGPGIVKVLSLALAAGVVAAGGPAAGEEPVPDNAVRLAPVVVTATRTPERAADQASAVSVVTREEMEIVSPRVVGDALQALPGVTVQRSGTPGNRENVKIRGGKGTHTLVMIDGFPVNSPSSGQFDIGSLRAEDFERVEVVRGAQSALYGSSAMTGVVNFIPRRGEGATRAGFSLAGGSAETAEGGGAVEGGSARGSFHAGTWGLASRGRLPNDGTALRNFLGTGGLDLGGKTRLDALILGTDEDKGIAVDFDRRDANHSMERRFLVAGLKGETSLSRAVAVHAAGSVAKESLRDDDPADPGQTTSVVFDDASRRTLLRLEARVSPAPFATTIAGMEYDKGRSENRTTIDDPVFPSASSLEASIYNRSLYLQEELRLPGRASASLGVRLDRSSEAGTEWNPKAAVSWLFEGIGTKVRGAVGRGFRVATPVEKFNPINGFRALSPETAVTWEAGADVALPGRAGTVRASWFYNDFRDIIQPDPTVLGGPFGVAQLRNTGKAFSRGVEAEARVAVLPRAEVAIAGAYTDSRESERGIRILGIPTWQGTLSVLATPAADLEVRADWHVEGDQMDFAPFEFAPRERPGFGRVDLFAAYRLVFTSGDFREVRLKGSVRNLLDHQYEERLGIPAPGLEGFAGVDVAI